MFDVSIEANADEFISNKPPIANGVIHVRRPFLNNVRQLVENKPASIAVRELNISHTLQ
jgi:hypothetical protein